MTLFLHRSFLTIFPMSIFEINTEDVYIFLTNHKYQPGFDRTLVAMQRAKNAMLNCIVRNGENCLYAELRFN